MRPPINGASLPVNNLKEVSLYQCKNRKEKTKLVLIIIQLCPSKCLYLLTSRGKFYGFVLGNLQQD